MSGRELDDYSGRAKRLTDHGVPEELASRVAVLATAYALLGIVETADRLDLDPVEVARVHFALGERLGLPALVDRIFALPRDDRWQTMARAAVRDDLYGVHQQLTARVLESTSADDSAPARVAEWEDADAGAGRRVGRHPGGDLPRGDGRARPAVGRPARRAWPAAPEVTGTMGLLLTTPAGPRRGAVRRRSRGRGRARWPGGPCWSPAPSSGIGEATALRVRRAGAPACCWSPAAAEELDRVRADDRRPRRDARRRTSPT